MTSESEEAGADAKPQPPEARFEHASAPTEAPPPAPEHVAVPALKAEPRPDPAPAAEPARAPAARGQEWPLAWLRLVETEPEPEPEPAAVEPEAHAAPVENAEAFGKAMAAALDDEPAASLDGKLMLFAAAEARPAAEPVEDATPAPANVDEALAAALEEPVFDKPVEPETAEPRPTRARARSKPRTARAPKTGPAVDAAPPPLELVQSIELVPPAESAPVVEAAAPVEAAPPLAEPEPPALGTPIYAQRASTRRKPQPQSQPQPQPRSEPRPQYGRRTHSPEPVAGNPGEGGVASSVYLLYLAGFLFAPSLAGVVIAYNARRDAPKWLKSHYLFQIRTFWIGMAGAAVALVLAFSTPLATLGLLFGLSLVVWLLARTALGFIDLVKLRPHARPRTWLI